VKGLRLAAWAAWDDAALKESLAKPTGNALYGLPGDRLPYSSRFSGNISVQQDFALTRRTNGFVGAAVSYVGDRLGVFQSTAQRDVLPSYAQTDVRAGITRGSWTVNVFVTNVSDKRGVLSGGAVNPTPTSWDYIQPRTAGMSVSVTF
jgi:hypothetical protein